MRWNVFLAMCEYKGDTEKRAYEMFQKNECKISYTDCLNIGL